MKRHLFLVLAILMVLVLVSGCTNTNNSSGKTYDANGITFVYPTSWKEVSASQLNLTAAQNNLLIVADEKSLQNNKFISVTVQKSSANQSLSDVVASQMKFLRAAKVQDLSEKNLTINGTAATEITYTGNVSGVNRAESTVFLVKNNNIYFLIFNTPTEDYDSQRANFDTIVGSFQVK
jgi:hypothetical protein